MIKIISLLSLCLLAQGCVGIATLKTRTETFQDPKVANNAMAGGLYHSDLNETYATTYTEGWLNAHWGKPSSIRKTDEGGQEEIWVYRFGPIWNGVIPIVLIPIPILLPTGREQVLFILRDGRVISGKQRESHSIGGAFGFSMGPCTVNFGAFSLTD